MPADRAAVYRCLVATLALCAVSYALFAAAARDHRHVVIMVRATPTLALASIEGRP
jgi:hypothetical protein